MKSKKQIHQKNSIYRIKDKCNEMPANRTILQVQNEDQEQKIQINLDCSSFYLSNFVEAKRVKKFLLFIFKIVRSKPQIKSAPISDILYM